jgi:hypothetical protein
VVPDLGRRLHIVVVIVILLSLVPIAIEVIRERRRHPA